MLFCIIRVIVSLVKPAQRSGEAVTGVVDSMLKASCPNCGKHYVVDERAAGKRVRCRACASEFVLPAASIGGDGSEPKPNTGNQRSLPHSPEKAAHSLARPALPAIDDDAQRDDERPRPAARPTAPAIDDDAGPGDESSKPAARPAPRRASARASPSPPQEKREQVAPRTDAEVVPEEDRRFAKYAWGMTCLGWLYFVAVALVTPAFVLSILSLMLSSVMAFAFGMARAIRGAGGEVLPGADGSSTDPDMWVVCGVIWATYGSLWLLMVCAFKWRTWVNYVTVCLHGFGVFLLLAWVKLAPASGIAIGLAWNAGMCCLAARNSWIALKISPARRRERRPIAYGRLLLWVCLGTVGAAALLRGVAFLAVARSAAECRLPSGETYTGEFSFWSRTPEGKGIAFYTGGARYEGEWSAGQRHGRGVWERVSQPRFEGTWTHGERSGLGTLVFRAGTFEGTWQADRCEEPGVFTFRDETIIQNAILSREERTVTGNGTVTYGADLRYTGEFRIDHDRSEAFPEGEGRLTYSGGISCEGSWHKRMPQGRCTITYPDGTLYTGEVGNAGTDARTGYEPEGKGTARLPDATVCDGIWQAGLLVRGSIKKADGSEPVTRRVSSRDRTWPDLRAVRSSPPGRP